MSFKKLLPILFVMLSFGAKANYMLVQNVTKLGNNPTNKTIQIQFDLSWQNSWRDSINWDAAWIFLKFKDANGLWQHARLNLAGYANGAGTTNIIKVASDSVGAFVYRSALGSGNFNATSMQIQWNYGASGLSDVSALEVRVFATEMVYVPEGDFNVAKGFAVVTSSNTCCSPSGTLFAPGNNFPVINRRLTPSLSYNDGTASNLRIKGDVGIDSNDDGIIDNTTYPTGYFSYYCFKYEMSEQQYADFLNTLTTIQLNSLGVAGTGIALSNGQYFSSLPNRACQNSNSNRFLAYADWSGLRPMSFLEFNKASYGPLQPVYSASCSGFVFGGYPSWGNTSCPVAFNVGNNTIYDVGYCASSTSSRITSGSSYYGIMDITGNVHEPLVKLNFFNFSKNHGNGTISISGNSDVNGWQSSMIIYCEQFFDNRGLNVNKYGFRYVRSAE